MLAVRDERDIAVKVERFCGHVSILTGEHMGLDEVPCLVCGLKVPVRKRTRGV